ncbi:MAG: cobalt-precorrin-5B (C(1))-methyltransferase CbiD [Desulfobacteraceae bacterium]|jgi:cobalt-precorrin-5B (C1)-methyltransferase|nr:cobalt-precorrin-5B (C(1))-methyltransferase CbiD [Desulfobacteraceae bacterium]
MGRFGITTGSCATAAAKAAAMMLVGKKCPEDVTIDLPGGDTLTVPIESSMHNGLTVTASVIKDAGDDPDVTHGSEICVSLEFLKPGPLIFEAGEGVGIVTRPGLQIPVGEAAVNPVPRQMIQQAVQQETDRPLKVTISVRDGKALAEKTFNPRLGVVGGISILGTTGIVRPNCRQAVIKTIQLSMRVAAAGGIDSPVLVPGNISAKAAAKWRGAREAAIIEVLNEWGTGIDSAVAENYRRVDLVGHPGKLAKLLTGNFYTHSKEGSQAVENVCRVAWDENIIIDGIPNTTEQIFAELDKTDGTILASALADRIAQAVLHRCENKLLVRVGLIRMDGSPLGESGWKGEG